MEICPRQFHVDFSISPRFFPHFLTGLTSDVEFVLRKASRLHRLGSLEDPAEIEYSAPGAEGLDLNLGRDLMGEGALQQAVALLPFIPNIFIKLGSLGVFCVRLVHKDAVIKDTDASTLRFPGLHADVVVQHHRGLPHQGIVSLTGGGYHLVSMTGVDD